MNNTLYELTCPHCGLKYSYDLDAGDPAQNNLSMRCRRCGQSEPIKDYYRMNRLPDNKLHGVNTILNSGVKSGIEDPLTQSANKVGVPNPNDVLEEEEGQYGTVLMPKQTMTVIDKISDPYIFRHPATLINPKTGESITMSVGEQIVGRMEPVGSPDKGFHGVPRTVSRRHVCITTTECGDGRFINTIMNCENKNITLLNDKELPAGAVWKMAKGMKLTMGELTVNIEDL